MRIIHLTLTLTLLSVLGLSAQTVAVNPDVTLKDCYKDAFKMGCAVNNAVVSGRDAISQRLVVSQFNSITSENEMKAETLNPRPGVWNFSPADAFVIFGQDNKQFIIGHTLVWHNQTPDWFFNDAQGKPKSREAMVEQMRSYIETVAGRYKGRVDAWDVVNEVIDNDGSYRQTTWVKAFGSGDDMVKHAFRFASQYAPGTELYYNDFNAWRPSKRDGIARMVRMLQKEGIRIDGIGIQGHWGLNFPKNAYIEAAIDTFAKLGVKVMITELDVDVLPITREGQLIGKMMSDPQWQLEEFKLFLDPYRNGLPPAVEQQLTDRYVELFNLFYAKRDKIDRVTMWGLHDGMSWKNDYPVPGRINYPLLFRRDKTPKPAFDAIRGIRQLAAASTPSSWYRVGGYEVFELNERSGKGALGILINVPDSVVATYAPDSTFDNAVNAFLVKKGDKVWVIDTGFGRKVFTLMDSLGIKPEQVQQVLLTHMHGDHIGGLVRDNSLLFPKASLVLSSKEFAYWSSQGERAAAANNILKLYKGQLMTPNPHQLTDALGDGIHMIEAYGHTPGHVMFLIKEGEEQLLIWGDLMHAAAIQYPHPEISVRYDTDPDMARETRLKVTQFVKAHAIPVAGMHLPDYLQYKTVFFR